MAYSCNDPLLYIMFPSSLIGVALDWFHSMLPRSPHNCEEVTKTFLTQYASRQEAKKNRCSGQFLTPKRDRDTQGQSQDFGTGGAQVQVGHKFKLCRSLDRAQVQIVLSKTAPCTSLLC